MRQDLQQIATFNLQKLLDVSVYFDPFQFIWAWLGCILLFFFLSLDKPSAPTPFLPHLPNNSIIYQLNT